LTTNKFLGVAGNSPKVICESRGQSFVEEKSEQLPAHLQAAVDEPYLYEIGSGGYGGRISDCEGRRAQAAKTEHRGDAWGVNTVGSQRKAVTVYSVINSVISTHLYSSRKIHTP
jgi:hypothetical protein